MGTKRMSQAEIAAANRRFEECVARQDADAVTNLFTPDAILLPITGEIVSGREAIRQRLKAAFASGRLSFEVRSVSIEVHGDFATDVGYETFRTAPSGAAATIVEATYLVVWKKIGGQWLLHRDMVGARA